MKMDENVAKAVERVDFCVDREKPVKWADWRAIRARMVELEAENTRVLAANRHTVDENRQLQDLAEKAEALLREVVAVAVTQLFDTHRADVEAIFPLADLQSMVELTEPLMAENSRVEDIYRKAFEFTAHLSENGHEHS